MPQLLPLCIRETELGVSTTFLPSLFAGLLARPSTCFQWECRNHGAGYVLREWIKKLLIHDSYDSWFPMESWYFNIFHDTRYWMIPMQRVTFQLHPSSNTLSSGVEAERDQNNSTEISGAEDSRRLDPWRWADIEKFAEFSLSFFDEKVSRNWMESFISLLVFWCVLKLEGSHMLSWDLSCRKVPGWMSSSILFQIISASSKPQKWDEICLPVAHGDFHQPQSPSIHPPWPVGR